MLVSMAFSNTAAACTTPRNGTPVAVATVTKRSAVPTSAMSPHSTAISAPIARMSSIVSSAFGLG